MRLTEAPETLYERSLALAVEQGEVNVVPGSPVQERDRSPLVAAANRSPFLELDWEQLSVKIDSEIVAVEY